MMNFISYKLKFAMLGAFIVPCFGRLALQGTGSETDFYRYLVPFFVGGIAGFLIGLMRDFWAATNEDLKTANKALQKEISGRELADQSLRESEKQKKAILDASLDSIRLVDKEMRIIWTNKIIETQLGTDREKTIGNYCYEAFTGRSEPCPNCPTEKSLKSGKTEHSIIIEDDVKGIEGKSYWADYAVPIKNNLGEIEKFIQVSRDISEIKKVEAKLLEKKNKLEIALADVKKLSGLLPICSSCKKIRDDTGYWNQIEEYIQKNSDAEFSHGICQECAKKYYPELDIYDE
jgi:PAS domain S-box-containing protein